MRRKINFILSLLLLCGIAATFCWVLIRQDQQRQDLAALKQQQTLAEQKWQSQVTAIQSQLREQQAQLQQLESRLQQVELQTQEDRAQIQAQQETILQLQATLERFIQASQSKLGAGGAFIMNCSEETFDYLAIGNSITIHDVCNYWPNVSGMAASTPEKDYFHLVSSGLEATKGTVNSYALSLFAWEVMATDRAEMAGLTEPYLTADLDLVTIQLGENTQDLATFRDDYVYLIQHIQQLAPNAKILVLGDFWQHEDRNTLKEQAAQECGVIFVSLNEIADDPAYQAGPVVEVTDENGQLHQIQHSGVSKHPSDEAMYYIAQATLSALR